MLSKVFMLTLLALPLVFALLSPIFLLWSGVMVYEGSWPTPKHHHPKHHSGGKVMETTTNPLNQGMEQEEPDMLDEDLMQASRRLLFEASAELPPQHDESESTASEIFTMLQPANASAGAAAGAATRACHHETDIDYHGHDIGSTSVKDDAGCCAYCTTIPECCYFTFKPVSPFPNKNCWAKPFFADAKKRRHHSPGHNSGHFTDGKCSKKAHQKEIDALKGKGGKKKCANASSMLKMWVLVTFLLAALLTIVLVVLVVLDLVFTNRDDAAGESPLLHAIQTGQRPMLGYVPFLMLFLNESSESIEVSATANMSSIKMHEVLNAVWAVGFDMWFAFGLMMLLAAASCASHIPCWSMLFLFLVFWAGVAGLTLLYGLKRAVIDAAKPVLKPAANQPTQKRNSAKQSPRGHVGPCTPMGGWDVQDLIPNPNDQRYMGYSTQPNDWRMIGPAYSGAR